MKEKINLELKYFCNNFDSVRKVLRKIGAKKMAIKKQKDYFFNLPQNKRRGIPARLKLRIEKDKKEIVFYRRPDFSKKLNISSDVAIMKIENFDWLDFFSKALGVRVVVEKQRELWKKGNTVFHFDNVRGVGKIFEIEVWTDKETMGRDKQKFTEYRKKVLPYLGKQIKGSNEDLVLNIRK